ncbi:MAG: prmC [Hyphomicrobiales bacterium]|nr:prmC [Hyphomicrobiales bacterium]
MSDNEIALVGLGLAEACRAISAMFADHGIDGAETDARMLLLGAAECSRTDLILSPHRQLDAEAARKLQGFASRRLAGEPATRILGLRAFWTLDLRVTPDVLDPRPDSETLILASLEALGARKDRELRILDLGTGSGALLLAILSECPRATGIGIDLSQAACAVARENSVLNGLADRARILNGRWFEGLEGDFDLIVSNPPYIESAAIPGLSVEVRQHDPMLALDGGADGLTAYRDILEGLPTILRPGGFAVFELGIGQDLSVKRLAEAAGLRVRAERRDLGGVVRALVLDNETVA